MRISFVLLLSSVVAVAGCTSTEPAPELPQTSSASADCVQDWDWAYAAKRGAVTFNSTCAYCHQKDGTGQTGQVPALAGNEGLAADPDRGIRLLLVTQTPDARTHGMEYDDMVAMLGELDAADLADALTYVLSSWGNCAGPIDAARVKAVAASM